MTGALIAIVGCAARKRPQPGPAEQVYTSAYFHECLATARALAPAGRVFILSAKYGLLRPGSMIEPYNLTFGQPGTIRPAQVAAQAIEHGLYFDDPVAALCGQRYTALLREVWHHVAAPLAHLGIGEQRATMAAIRRALAGETV